MSLLRSRGRIAITLAIIGTVCACRVNSYVLAPGSEHGWVTVEEGNSSCAAQRIDQWRTTFAISRTRIACTSTPTHQGWEFNRYYLAQPDGSAIRLGADELIHRRSFFAVGQLGSPCFYSGTQFFFGTLQELSTSQPVAFSSEYKLEHHSECP